MALTWTKTGPGDFSAALPDGTAVAAHVRRVPDARQDVVVVEWWVETADGSISSPHERVTILRGALAAGTITKAAILQDLQAKAEEWITHLTSAAADFSEIPSL